MQIDFEKLQIRKASVDDADQIISILNNAATWIHSKGINQWRPGSFDRKRLLDRIKNGEVYVAVFSNFIVGTFRLQMHDKSVWGDLDSNEEFVYLHRLAIKNEFHGQDLGLKLLRHAERIAHSMQKKGIRLDCLSENSVLKNYYENTAGYTPVRTVMTDYCAQLFEKKFTL